MSFHVNTTFFHERKLADNLMHKLCLLSPLVFVFLSRKFFPSEASKRLLMLLLLLLWLQRRIHIWKEKGSEIEHQK